MGKKIRDAQAQKVPYMAVVGGREAEAGAVNVRNRAGEQTTEPVDDFARRVAQEVADKTL